MHCKHLAAAAAETAVTAAATTTLLTAKESQDFDAASHVTHAVG
jgi:hypothetical protein